MTTEKRSPGETRRHGVALALAELAARGLEGQAGEGRSQNTITARRSTGTAVTIRVKTRRSGTWQTTTADAEPDPAPDPNSFVLFVDAPEGKSPRFFVVPDHEYRREVYLEHAAYRKRNHGQRRPEVTHHKVTTSSVAEWQDRWDLLGRA